MLKRLCVLFAIIFCSTNNAFAETKERNLDDVTILVSSYDKFANLWPVFFDLLFKYWPSLKTYNKEVPILLVSNTKDFSDPRVTVVKSPIQLGWNGNIAETLKHVQTKYVLYIQDDYFIDDDVSEDKIINIVNAAKKNNLDYAEIRPRCAFGKEKVDGLSYLNYKDPNGPECFTTLQVALWKKEALQEMTSIGTPQTIWSLEGIPLKTHTKFAYYTPKIKPMSYYNFMYRGHINFMAYCWLNYMGYDLSFLNDYKIRPQYKFFISAQEFREKMPKLSNYVFYVIGFFKEVGYRAKKCYLSLVDAVNSQ